MSVEAPAAGRLSGRIVFPMAAACAFAVATLYYNQPLLPSMAASFGCSVSEAGWIATATQLGYALGLLLFVPLGDRVDRRTLILSLLVANMSGLALCAGAPTLTVAAFASFALGFTAVSAQIIIPAVSGLVATKERGRTIGILLSGLSTGLLLGRTISGLVGAHFGWRVMFELAIALDVLLMVLVWHTMPAIARTTDLDYPRLLASLWHLFIEHPVLRAACLSGFLLFAGFGAFWSTMAGLLARPPYGFGPAAAGAFGLLGAIGISVSPSIGRLTDRLGSRRVLAGAAVVVASAFGLVAMGAGHLWAVFATVVFLDLGNRAALVANQTAIFALDAEARSRLNTVFMCCYFLGGAAGSQLGQIAVARSEWRGLALTGMALAVAALAFGSVVRESSRPASLSRTPS